MPVALKVPWDRIREAIEKGTPQAEVAKLFNISKHTIRKRSLREDWDTPKRLANKLDKVLKGQGYKVTGLEQLEDDDEPAKKPLATKREEGTEIVAPAKLDADIADLARQYKNHISDKLFKLVTHTTIAPPRTWKDFDIADKMIRRTLGLDDGEGKANTIVQLQVVNERLRQQAGGPADDIIEGEIISLSEAESVPEVSQPQGV